MREFVTHNQKNIANIIIFTSVIWVFELTPTGLFHIYRSEIINSKCSIASRASCNTNKIKEWIVFFCKGGGEVLQLSALGTPFYFF